MIGFQSENNSPLYIPYIKTLYPLQNDTHHHVSSNISSFCKKIPSKNCLPKLTRVPRVSPPFFRCWGYINPQTLRRFSHEGQGAFGSVYEARDVKSMQMVVCKVQWKIQKKQPTNDQPMTMNRANHPKEKRNSTQFFLMVWVGGGIRAKKRWREKIVIRISRDQITFWTRNPVSQLKMQVIKIKCFFKYLMWKKCRISAIRWIRHKHKRLHLTLHIEVWL